MHIQFTSNSLSSINTDRYNNIPLTPHPPSPSSTMRSRDAEAELNLPPGFRFHPTDEELVVNYLCRKAAKQDLPVPIIAEVDLYKFNPWQLPEMALFGNKEWYFFTPRDRKYPNGSRPNRAAGSGYWKATGADKPVTPAGRSKPVGIKKALVFYAGKAPKGVKTNWIMHEYRLADADRSANKRGSLRLDDWVLCRLYNKKKDWRKDVHQRLQQQQNSEDISLGNTMTNSFTVDGLAWDSHRSPASDVDNDDFFTVAELDGRNQFLNTPKVGLRVKEDMEEEDWFMDLKLEDLGNESFQHVGVPPGMFPSCQGNFFYHGFSSPLLHKSSSQLNLMMPF